MSPKVKALLRTRVPFTRLPQWCFSSKSTCCVCCGRPSMQFSTQQHRIWTSLIGIPDNYVRDIGLTATDAFLDHNLAPLRLRTDIGSFRFLYAIVLGLAHPEFGILFPAPPPANTTPRHVTTQPPTLDWMCPRSSRLHWPQLVRSLWTCQFLGCCSAVNYQLLQQYGWLVDCERDTLASFYFMFSLPLLIFIRVYRRQTQHDAVMCAVEFGESQQFVLFDFNVEIFFISPFKSKQICCQVFGSDCFFLCLEQTCVCVCVGCSGDGAT